MSVSLLFVRLKDRFHVLGHLSKWFTFFRVHGPVSSSHIYLLGSNYFKKMYAKNLLLTFSGIAFWRALEHNTFNQALRSDSSTSL